MSPLPVLIIGAGPAGLTLAALLGEQQVDCLVLERRAGNAVLPRAHLINQRTMEIFGDLGLADEIYALSPPEHRWHRVAWYTSLGGPSELGGREIAHLCAWGGGDDAQRYREASPMAYANVPQLSLDPLLRARVQQGDPDVLRFGHEVVALRQDADSVIATVRDEAADRSYELAARYVVVADGGRGCAEMLGVRSSGPRDVARIVSQHVTMDLSSHVVDDEVLLYYFINPGGRGQTAGSMLALGPKTFGRHSREWLVHLAFAVDDPAADDRAGLIPRIRRLLGIPELEIDVHSVSRWTLEGLVADDFRRGRAFIIGNAAHRHPPTGGLGLNCAVQDAANLAWKLTAVLRGEAGPALLESFASERRPVGVAYVEHSLANRANHALIAGAMGLRPGQTESEGWDEIRRWASPDAEGRRRRDAVESALASHRDNYSHLNLEVGYSYDAGAVIADGTPPPPRHASPIEYEPTTRPGHHLPHVWLARDGAPVSSIGLVARRGLTLLVDPAGERAWSEAAAAAGRQAGCTVDVVAVGADAAVGDPSGRWTQLRGVGPRGALLVRPDRHVAWRSPSMPPRAARHLTRVVAEILARDDVAAAARRRGEELQWAS